MKEKNLELDNFRGDIIYGDLYAETIIRQGYIREVELTKKDNKIVLENKLIVEKTIKELQKILKNWI